MSAHQSHRLYTWTERVTIAIAVVITVVIGAGIAIVAVGVHGGYQAVAMSTGSMAPGIRPGDMAIIQRTDPRQLRVGDVITFAAPIDGAPIVTHRIVSIEAGGAGPTFKTKGDANQAPDVWTVHYSSTAWRVTRVLPSAGAALDFLQGTGGRVITGVLIFVIVLALISAPSPTNRRPPAVPTGAPA